MTDCLCFNFKGAKILEASHFDYEYTLGHKIIFLCVARGTPRPYVTWFKDGSEIYAHYNLMVSRSHRGVTKGGVPCNCIPYYT